MNRFSPSEAALEGFRLTRERPLTVLAWAGLYFVGMSITAVLMMLILGPEFIGSVKAGKLSSDPDAVAQMLSHSAPAFGLVMILVVGLMSVLTAGIYRIILRPEEGGFVHLRLGADELRLTAVNLLLFALGVACFVVGVSLVRVAMQFGPLAEAVAVVLVACFTAWIGVRLCMATPMTFAMRRVSIRSAWALSRGSFWRLLGMTTLAVIFYIMILLLVTIISMAIVAFAGGQGAVADITHLTPMAAASLVATVILQQIIWVLQVVMIYAPFGVAYEQLHGDVSVDPLRPHPATG